MKLEIGKSYLWMNYGPTEIIMRNFLENGDAVIYYPETDKHGIANKNEIDFYVRPMIPQFLSEKLISLKTSIENVEKYPAQLKFQYLKELENTKASLKHLQDELKRIQSLVKEE